MSSLLNKTTVIVAISCLLVGRYVLTPKPKVVTKEVIKIVEVEKKTVDTKKKKVTKEVKKKDDDVDSVENVTNLIREKLRSMKPLN